MACVVRETTVEEEARKLNTTTTAIVPLQMTEEGEERRHTTTTDLAPLYGLFTSATLGAGAHIVAQACPPTVLAVLYLNAVRNGGESELMTLTTALARLFNTENKQQSECSFPGLYPKTTESCWFSRGQLSWLSRVNWTLQREHTILEFLLALQRCNSTYLISLTVPHSEKSNHYYMWETHAFAKLLSSTYSPEQQQYTDESRIIEKARYKDPLRGETDILLIETYNDLLLTLTQDVNLQVRVAVLSENVDKLESVLQEYQFFTEEGSKKLKASVAELQKWERSNCTVQ